MPMPSAKLHTYTCFAEKRVGLCRLSGETETEQSAVDPLDPDTVRSLPLYAHACPRVFVLHPGEAVIIPQVWLPKEIYPDRRCCSRMCLNKKVTTCGRSCDAARQGWWHYAVALDASITVMQNFYNAPSNAAGLVELVQKTAAATRAAKAVHAQYASMP